MSGTGATTPRYFQSRDSIAFGDTLVNGTAKATVTVGNEGTGNLQISSISRTGSSTFSITPATPATYAGGDFNTYVVSFTPTSTFSIFTGTITFFTNDGIHAVNLSGRGAESRWVKLLDASIAENDATLHDILMMDDGRRGFVVGDGGTILETDNQGRSWIP